MIGCANGKYGDECKEECGYCRDVKQCVHSNGSCLTGCSYGFQGELCKTREYIPTKLFIKCLDIHTLKLKHIELKNAYIWKTVYPVIFELSNFRYEKFLESLKWLTQKWEYIIYPTFENFATRK